MRIQIIGRYDNSDVFRNRHRKLALIEIDPDSEFDLKQGEFCMLVKEGLRPLANVPIDALVAELTQRSEGLKAFPS